MSVLLEVRGLTVALMGLLPPRARVTGEASVLLLLLLTVSGELSTVNFPLFC